MSPSYTQKRRKDGSIYRIAYYRCIKTMHLNNAVCTIKHLNVDQVEQLVIILWTSARMPIGST